MTPVDDDDDDRVANASTVFAERRKWSLCALPSELLLIVINHLDANFNDVLSLRSANRTLYNVLSRSYQSLVHFDASIVDFSLKFIKLALRRPLRIGRRMRRAELFGICVGNGWNAQCCVKALDDLTEPGTVLILVRSQIVKSFRQNLTLAVDYVKERFDDSELASNQLLNDFQINGRIEFIADGDIGLSPETTEFGDPFFYSEPPHDISLAWNGNGTDRTVVITGSERGDVCAAVVRASDVIMERTSVSSVAACHLSSYLRMLERRWAYNAGCKL